MKKHYNVPFYVTKKEYEEIGSAAFDQKKIVVTEDHYYFENGKMIQWLNKKKLPVLGESEEFKAAEKDVLKRAENILSKFGRSKVANDSVISDDDTRNNNSRFP